eukprot:CAMPEP_0119134676 /NCGR_PEP_ID=MMETSP1310-20130426/17526_1 /TAXON_ID=464262 /ORGANISM="Genus nov. species nov., Strain RCC2339" /LENGTH=612 /DNA_ID=CAMNT_0007125497 /DNA_START=7 /DNA_END=1845 /DNA_ORIENTATION=+
MAKSNVRIGCYSAFWGDSSAAAFQLVRRGKLDYLVADYLAEVTMGILARMKAKDKTGKGGFIPDFVLRVWKPLMKEIVEKKIKVVTNAGGLNPTACKEAIETIAAKAGLHVQVAAVEGDDLQSSYKSFASNSSLQVFHANDQLPDASKVMSTNAYLGARPIADVLNQGAQVVVVGRCVDSAVVLGPLMHEFGWKKNDFDLLAAGSLAGHIIECACQTTGGNYTDWKESAFSPDGGWANMGYPIAEMYSDGRFFVTKPEATGGVVNIKSVAEQMVYEIGDPGAYILPDVIVDMRQVKLEACQSEKNRVWVSGTKGLPPTNQYKTSVIWQDGYKMSGEVLIGGFDARAKAEAVLKGIVKRVEGLLALQGLEKFNRVCYEYLGSDQLFPYSNRPEEEVREVVARVAVHHHNRKALLTFASEVAPAATSTAPGITGGGSGRPRPVPLLVHTSALIEKKHVPVRVLVGGKPPSGAVTFDDVPVSNVSESDNTVAIAPLGSPVRPLPGLEPLVRFAYGRSGDKGNTANIGIVARDPRHYEHLLSILTPQVVFDFLAHVIGPSGRVIRYTLPGIYGMNFIVTESLDGGGLSSLRSDRQGKSYAQVILTMPVVPPSTSRL